MLDGILNRGFSSKCKSLIKATRTRIEVLRRRAEAKQRFLKEDLFKLLDNGLDINAFGRTEEYLLGQNLLFCYDFVEQSCEFIVKQLSYMQKLRDCPEDCREAVASLMFAAARFSDLPELREIRDLFQERYRNALECFVNQKFVEKLSSRPPAVEKRIQLLQDIALEFSIRWDSSGFQQRMALSQAQPNRSRNSHASAGNHIPLNGKSGGSKADEHDIALGQRPKGFNDQQRIQKVKEGITLKKEQLDVHSFEKKESSMVGIKPLTKQDTNYSKGRNHDILFDKEVEYARTRNKAAQAKDDISKKIARSGSSSHGERHLEDFDNKFSRQNEIPGQIHMGRAQDPLSCARPEAAPSRGLPFKSEGVASASDRISEKTTVNSTRRVPEDDVLKKISKSGSSSHGDRQLEGFNNKFTGQNEIRGQIHMGRVQDPLSYARSEAAPSRGLPFKSEDVSSASDRISEKTSLNSTRLVPHEDGNRFTNFALPPPYLKAVPPPYVKPNESKERAHKGPKQPASECDGYFGSTSPRIRLDAASSSNRTDKESDLADNEAQAIKATRINSHNNEKELYYKDGLTLPKPRSVRRKHHKSTSNHVEERKSEDARVVKKSSSSRRREHSRKGLQILFDDEHHKKDDEERMIDKLLLHYSKKPSTDLETLKTKPQAHISHLTTPDTKNRTDRLHGMEPEMVPFPKRSISLPHEQNAAPSEATKVFARANSFQPDNQACHVHPKLPDYDDLTARFAALRGR